MSKRFVSVWLKYWPTERRRRTDGGPAGPLALTVPVSGGMRISAVDALAASEGIAPGMTLADARALLPGLAVLPADPAGDARTLASFVDWCGRYTPFAADDGVGGAVLDIAGCAHLFGDEAKLLGDLQRRLGRMNLTAGVAVADTPGAAWAWARYGKGDAIPSGETRHWLAPLPVAALRLPAETAERLNALGLHRIGDLYALPRTPLARRCGVQLLERFDQVLGCAPEPISPTRPVPEWRSRIAFAEPIGRAEDIAEAVRRLIMELCALLERHDRGIRRLELVCARVDGTSQRLGIGVGRPSRDTGHLMKLFQGKLDQVEPGFGIEEMRLEAMMTDPFSADQPDMAGRQIGNGSDLSPLIDRLRNRFGDGAVFRMVPVESHIPERAVTIRAATEEFGKNVGHDDWMSAQPRPVRLFAWPEPIDATAVIPDGPPRRFTWRRIAHNVRLAEGPERIGPEWWRRDGPRRFRDYYRLEDEEGRRFWAFHDGAREPGLPARWYMHGLFA